MIHLHGSTFWFRDDESTRIDVSADVAKRKIISDAFEQIDSFSAGIGDETKVSSQLPKPKISDEQSKLFWEAYERLPIVNPTKWKFHETVFEEQYYQFLRHLSYELEKPNAVLLTFGFSFADEHILNIVKRSLSNPSLQVFVCCFDENERRTMEDRFATFPNVELVSTERQLTFSTFNLHVFNLDSTQYHAEIGAEG